MIDYLKLEGGLKPFYDYKAEKEYEEKIDKIEKIIFGMSPIVLASIIYYIISPKISPQIDFFSFFIFSAFGLMLIYELILRCSCPKDFWGSDYETEENLSKVSEFGIKNIKNFKENIALLKRKTEYMLLNEKIRRTEEYSAKEIYINKILNMFYGTDKTDMEKQDMELLELLKR